MNNIVKRMINVFVSVPILLLVTVCLIFYSAWLARTIDHLEMMPPPVSTVVAIGFVTLMLSLSTIDLAMLFAAIMCGCLAIGVIVCGDGLPYRRGEEGDFIQNPDGTIFHKIEKTEWIWWCNPMLRGRKLVSYGVI